LGAFNSISPEDDFNTPRDATSGQLSLDLLDSNLLEVDESRLVDVKNKPGPIVTLKTEIKKLLGFASDLVCIDISTETKCHEF